RLERNLHPASPKARYLMLIHRAAGPADPSGPSTGKTTQPKAPPGDQSHPGREVDPDNTLQPNPGQVDEDEDQEWRRAGGGVPDEAAQPTQPSPPSDD